MNSPGLSAFKKINIQIKVKIHHLFPLSNRIKKQRNKRSQIQLISQIKISMRTMTNKSFPQVALKSQLLIKQTAL